MEQFRQRYAALQTSWTRTAPDSPEAAQAHAYDRWVARANNASFAAQGAYDDLVPGFEALFARVDGTGPGGWGRFYAAVRELADQPRAERRRALDQLRLSTKSA